MDIDHIINVMMYAASLAGAEILEVYNREDFGVRFKTDETPVTIADNLSNKSLCGLLHTAAPNFGILTEEEISEDDFQYIFGSLSLATQRWREAEWSWVLDPLDGTSDFIRKTGDFGIHIAVTKVGVPYAGIHYYPLSGTYYVAIKGGGCMKISNEGSERITVSKKANISSMILAVSRFHKDGTLQRIADEIGWTSCLEVGGGKKYCMVADDSADVYLSLNSKSSLWDSCAGQLIVEEAGGKVTDKLGDKIDYRQNGSTRLLNGVVATNGVCHERIIKLIHQYL